MLKKLRVQLGKVLDSEQQKKKKNKNNANRS
jgi:hypothetical protein